MSKLTTFVTTTEKISEIGLIVCKDKPRAKEIEETLTSQLYSSAHDWKGILEVPGKVSLLVSTEAYTAELDELLTQNARGKAHIQIMERASLELVQKTLDYRTKSILLIIDEATLEEVSMRYNILATVGPVYREVSYDS